VAHKFGLRVNFTVYDVAKIFSGDVDDITNLLKVFKSLDKDNDGALNFDEFCSALGLDKETSHAAERLFVFFDNDENGKMDFREFIVAVSLASTKCKVIDSAKVVFEVCDYNGDGKVDAADLKKVLELARASDKMKKPMKDAVIDVKKGINPDSTKQVSDEEIFNAVFSRSQELSMSEFVEVMVANEAVAQTLLNLFIWKRFAPDETKDLHEDKADL